MGPRFLIDTNCAIDFVGQRLPAVSLDWLRRLFDAQLYGLSVINRMELLSRPSPPTVDRILHEMIQFATVFALDEPVILETIRLRQHYHRKLPDTIIAATALVHGLTLVTRNVADFKAIAGLTVVDPHDAAGLPAGP